MSTLRTNNIANVAGTQSTDVLNVINGSAKAWVNFNGTGTVAIRASYNVSSITDGGVGIYTVNFTNPLPDTNYAAVFGVKDETSSAPIISISGLTNVAYSTTQIGLRVWTYTGSQYDSSIVNVSIFR